MSEDVILVEKVGKISKVILNRPKCLNALSVELVEKFAPAIRQADEDPDTNVILLCASGPKAFTAGFDLKESIEEPIVDVPARRENSLLEVNTMRSLWEAKKPVICAVQGWCIGGGVWMMMHSDIVIAADNAKFGEPELKYSYISDVLPEPWKMSMNRVKQFLFFGEYWGAQEMKEAGVVNYIVPADELQDKAMEYAQKLAEQPAQATRMLKYEINQTYEIMGMQQAQRFAAEMFNQCRIYQIQEQAAFNQAVKEQGLKAAMDQKK